MAGKREMDLEIDFFNFGEIFKFGNTVKFKLKWREKEEWTWKLI